MGECIITRRGGLNTTVAGEHVYLRRRYSSSASGNIGGILVGGGYSQAYPTVSGITTPSVVPAIRSLGINNTPLYYIESKADPATLNGNTLGSKYATLSQCQTFIANNPFAQIYNPDNSSTTVARLISAEKASSPPDMFHIRYESYYIIFSSPEYISDPTHSKTGFSYDSKFCYFELFPNSSKYYGA